MGPQRDMLKLCVLELKVHPFLYTIAEARHGAELFSARKHVLEYDLHDSGLSNSPMHCNTDIHMMFCSHVHVVLDRRIP